MIILDQPYVSKEILDYIKCSNTPVLENETSLALLKNTSNLVSEKNFSKTISNNKRIYTCSENSIDWIINNIDDTKLHTSIQIMKDKALFREKIKPSYPSFFFREAKLHELSTLNTTNFNYPFILKPKVGFFSIGVYNISREKDWINSVNDIIDKSKEWRKTFPKSVVNNEFILEEYIHGEEFAIDAYYDENGNPVILNILKHDFNGIDDVSDRLYYTGKIIIENYLEPFTNWLTDMNNYFNIKDFPFHAEVRINNGKITPIEFNPLRFAGWCCTDLSKFAFDFYTYDYYLNNKKPNWNEILKNKNNKLYTIVVMDKSSHTNDKIFNYDNAVKDLGEILTLRKIDYNNNSIYGFLFTEINENDKNIMKNIVTRNFDNYLE